MKRLPLYLFFLLAIVNLASGAQPDSSTTNLSSFQILLKDYYQKKLYDSVAVILLNKQLQQLPPNNIAERNSIMNEIKGIRLEDSLHTSDIRQKVTELKKITTGAAVVPFQDTYNRIGSTSPADRASRIEARIKELHDKDLIELDSLKIIVSEITADIIYRDWIMMSITDLDALWFNTTKNQLAEQYLNIIKAELSEQKEVHSLQRLIIRIGLTLLIVASFWVLVYLINKGYKRIKLYLVRNRKQWLRDLSFKNYTFLTARQEYRAIINLMNISKIALILTLLLISMPLIFSIFPFTRGWAQSIFSMVWNPVRTILSATWNYLPNLFAILVIVFAMKYFIRLVKYFFNEIDSGKLVISGFHSDWAMPTFSIVKGLLYAFMLVIIFPYLPGSDSNIFKGVSVFVGVLFSLGSSSAISNMVAGLIITYMRPFKLGDRVKIGEMVGDVIEKSLLVTRLRTIKNEEITIPNSSILSGNTTNYTSFAQEGGLIVHTTITIGYDVPWREMHAALLDAADRCTLLNKEPKPFVFQTSLDDFYVSYQLNAHTLHAGRRLAILSEMHQNIQDCCNERGIEIMSPHYRAQRDGNTTTIPQSYLPNDYQAPSFRVDKTQRP
jgi:small-conductance mechanosensitive channel